MTTLFKKKIESIRNRIKHFDQSYRLYFIFYFPTNQHEFNLHARSRALNIHHCLREKRGEIKNKRGEGTRIESTNVFTNETRANFQLDFLFRFEYKSLRICSPLFRLLLLYVAPGGEKYSTGKRYCYVLIAEKMATARRIIRASSTDSTIRFSLNMTSHNSFLKGRTMKIISFEHFPLLGHFKREINLTSSTSSYNNIGVHQIFTRCGNSVLYILLS